MGCYLKHSTRLFRNIRNMCDLCCVVSFTGNMLIILFHPLVGIPKEKKIGEIKWANSHWMSLKPRGDRKDGTKQRKTPEPLKSGVSLINMEPQNAK